MNNITISDTAGKIVRFMKSRKLQDVTLRSLIMDAHLSIDDTFYKGLNRLIKENKIVFLVTPVDTYVIPVL